MALLDRLELTARGAFRLFDALHDSDPVAVAAACDQVRTTTVGSLLAEAVWSRFSARLAGPLERDVQEHSIDGSDLSRPLEAAFEDYQHGYGNGELTWAGVWGVTSSPPEIRDPLIADSEMDRGRISRWRLPVRDDVPVLEIDSPRDWFRLVETFPQVATGPHCTDS